LAEENLPRDSLVAQAGGDVRDAPERAVVVASFEADAAERRVTNRDSGAQTQVITPFPPTLRTDADALSHRQRKLGRLELRLLDRRGVVEEDHQTVASEVLQRAAVPSDELARRLVVLPHDVDQLLGLRGLGERREPAQVEVRDDDVRAVSSKKLLASVARDELRHLRREETRELRPLALDCLEQSGIGDRDRRLVRERLHELNVLLGERLRDIAGDRHDADQVVVKKNWDP
jgi:hypothetical protein